MVLGQLVELDHDAVGAFRMDEGIPPPTHPDQGLLVDELDAALLQAGEHAFDVVHLQAQVVHAGAALLQVASQAAAGCRGLDELHLAIADGQEGDPGAFLRYVFEASQAQPNPSCQKASVSSMFSTSTAT